MPGTDLFPDVLKSIVSQGPLFGFMAVLIVYFVTELRQERQRHAATTDRLIELTEESTKASTATAAALAGLQSMTERFLYDRRDRGNER